MRKVASAFRTPDRSELEAALAARLLIIKSELPGGIRDWEAYLAKFLYNKASNWVRDQRRLERRIARLQTGRSPIAASDPASAMPQPSIIPDSDRRLAFAAAWKQLDRTLRLSWTVLHEENGNRAAAANRLGIHRNTLRLRLERIKRTLARAGIGPE